MMPAAQNNNQPPSFICVDCGYEVFQFPMGLPLPSPPRCATCQWIANIPDDVDREKLRKWLNQLK